MRIFPSLLLLSLTATTSLTLIEPGRSEVVEDAEASEASDTLLLSKDDQQKSGLEAVSEESATATDSDIHSIDTDLTIASSLAESEVAPVSSATTATIDDASDEILLAQTVEPEVELELLDEADLSEDELEEEPAEEPVLILEEAPGDNPAPEYLNQDPNPLLFPTTPEEVEVLGTQPITLEQALELAQRNNRELQIAQRELEQSIAALREARAALYPTLDAGSNLTVEENQSTGLSELFGVEQDEADTTLQGTLQLNYDLFTSGQRSASIRAAEASLRLRELLLEQTVEELRVQVINNYYDLQEADEEVRIARATVDEAQQSLEDAQALERAGLRTRLEVLQAEVDLANFQQELNQALSAQQIARRQLVRRLNLAEYINLSAADPVESAGTWDLSLEESIVLAYRNRAELEQQLLQREIANQQRRIALSGIGPQISLFADYNVFNTLNDEDSDFNDLYRFGVQLQWRLFDAGAARARADQEEANIAIAEEQFADTRNQVRLEVETAYYNLLTNAASIDTARLAVQQAEEALRLARLRFAAGVGTQVDVLRQQTDLARAERNLVRAIVGYNRSLANLQRAVSNYPDSDLSDILYNPDYAR
jgi:OMF family outer membrane factor